MGFERPGILTDAFPSPYPNEETSRFANGGALPPDLSVYTTAKHEGLDFIFTLLVGYRDLPAGFPVREGLYFNPYYPGGVLAMPPPLSVDGQIEYEDGTPCTNRKWPQTFRTSFVGHPSQRTTSVSSWV